MKLLIVEDDKLTAQFVRLTLEEDGHDVEDWLEAERELTTRRLTVS